MDYEMIENPNWTTLHWIWVFSKKK